MGVQAAAHGAHKLMGETGSRPRDGRCKKNSSGLEAEVCEDRVLRKGFLKEVAVLGPWKMDKTVGRAEEGSSAAMGSMGKVLEKGGVRRASGPGVMRTR